MARIADYSKDTTITGGDKVIGTNQANGDTVNFLVEDLANYITSVADVDVSVANLKIRLPQIDSDVTIGNGSGVDTTISGNLNVNGNLTVNGTIAGLSVEESLSVVFNVKNTSGGLLPKGTVVHVASTQSSQGNIIDVVKADNSSSSGMPAIGILNVQLADDGEGEAVVLGRVSNIDTSAFTAGDELYVNTNGDFTNVKPTGTALIQKIAVVIKSHASNGSIEVFGAGRSNDVPNIALNNIWVGNASGVPTPTVHTIENITDVNITNLQDNQILKYNSSTSKWQNEADGGGGGGIQLTDLSVGTEGTASGDGDVSYNNSTGVFTYTPPDLSSYLTSVSLNDLTDTTITSPANGQVLKYNSTTSRFENQADAEGIALTDLSVGAEASASGDGAIAYNNTTGVFTYTPPDLSSYLTSAVDGTGTANNLPIWSDADTLTDSILTQDSGATKIQVAGGIDTTGIIQTSTTNANLQIQGNGTGGVEVRGAGGNDGKIQINCSVNSHGVTLQSPPHSSGATYTLILPTTSGTSGQVLTSGGSSPSQLTWSTPSTGTIDGTGSANKLAIWSDADTLTNNTNLHWDATNDRLGIGTNSPSSKLDVNGNTNITGTLGVTSGLTSASINVGSFIYHDGDTDTYIGFGLDSITLGAGNIEFLRLNEGATDELVVNEQGVDIDFRVESSGNANMLFIDGGNNKVGIGTDSPATSLDINATDAIIVPKGTSTQRDALTAESGMFRFNTTDNGFEGYNGTEWGVIGGNIGTSRLVNDAVTHDKLENRYTAVVSKSDTSGTGASAIDIGWDDGTVFNFTATLTGAIELKFDAYKVGQVIDIYGLTGSQTITFTSTGAGTTTVNNVGAGEYDGSTTNHIQVVCLAEGSSPVFNYSTATYASDNSPNA